MSDTGIVKGVCKNDFISRRKAVYGILELLPDDVEGEFREGEVVGMIRAMKAVVHAPAASVRPRFIGEEADDERHDT